MTKARAFHLLVQVVACSVVVFVLWAALDFLITPRTDFQRSGFYRYDDWIIWQRQQQAPPP